MKRLIFAIAILAVTSIPDALHASTIRTGDTAFPRIARDQQRPKPLRPIAHLDDECNDPMLCPFSQDPFDAIGGGGGGAQPCVFKHKCSCGALTCQGSCDASTNEGGGCYYAGTPSTCKSCKK